MTIRVLAVHGIGNLLPSMPHVAADELTMTLRMALADGLARYAPSHEPVDLRAAYYAHHLNPPEQGGSGEPSPEEQSFLNAFAVAHGMDIKSMEGATFVPAFMIANWIARQLGRAGDENLCRRIAQAVSNVARDACSYLHHPERRMQARAEVTAAISRHEPDVVVAHSLGSVVVYETLWTQPQVQVPHLITVGSPLALPGAVFDHLQPPPMPDARSGRGRIPANVERWTNLADFSDVVAIPRPLHARFDGLDPDNDREISIGMLAIHGFTSYLSHRSTVAAVIS